MGALASFARLIAAGWILVRADALAPREIDPILPVGPRALARALRIFSGPASRRGRAGERLARCLETLGPVAIKFGQFLATRADIFGGLFCEDLSRLKDRLAPFPTAEARAEIERGLGRPLSAIFASFEEPIAAASLAQAHRVTLLDGRPGAVKVLRPGIEARVARDGAALKLAGDIIGAWVPAARRLEPEALVATVLRTLQLELDLRLEAAGADELRVAMAADPYMRAPRVIWEGVAQRVLTLELAQGIALSDPLSLQQPGLDRRGLADNLVRAFLAQALDHGVFHADLHEGNLFVEAPAILTAVDFGIIGRLGPGERRYLAEILWGFLQRDYPRVAAIHFDAGYVRADQDRAAFAQALRAVGEPVFGRTATNLSMGRLLAQLFQITALFDMRLRPELVLLQKTMVTVEGVARVIDPDHDIWAAAEPVVRRWIARELSPVARARSLARDAFAAVAALARLAEREQEPPLLIPARNDTVTPLLAFACGVVVAALAFALTVLVR
ncbi:MAG TPA: 2-polyprenylphenol 6-hydroxylase [Caulobacteraceae bacterium]